MTRVWCAALRSGRLGGRLLAAIRSTRLFVCLFVCLLHSSFFYCGTLSRERKHALLVTYIPEVSRSNLCRDTDCPG
jgi:hypothetical protein